MDGTEGTGDQRASRRREKILDAAFSVFSRLGYRDAAVDEIARQAATSKGGLYFHFPTKESLYIELLHGTADKLIARVERASESEPDPVRQADAALRVVVATFGGHRSMARFLLIDALGAGRAFQAEIVALHERFAALIAGYLDRAVVDGIIEPLDTRLASRAWFGALNEIVTRWLMAPGAERLDDAYPTLRELLLRGVGVSAERIAALPRP